MASSNTKLNRNAACVRFVQVLTYFVRTKRLCDLQLKSVPTADSGAIIAAILCSNLMKREMTTSPARSKLENFCFKWTAKLMFRANDNWFVSFFSLLQRNRFVIRHLSFVICWSSSVAHHVCTEWLKFRVISVNWIIIWLASDHYYHITANGNRQPSIEHFRQYKMHCDVWHVPTTHWLRLQRRNDAHSHIRICNAWCVWTFDSTAFPPMQHTH